MLRCLEDQQRQQHNSLNLPGIRAKSLSDSAEKATRHLNNGYRGLLTIGRNIRPPPNFFSPTHLPSRSSNLPRTSSFSSSPSTSSSPTPNPEHSDEPVTPQPADHTKSLNHTTVELEHQKLESEPVIPAKELEGLGPVDYWLVRYIFLDQCSEK